jgi:hypothetical protein
LAIVRLVQRTLRDHKLIAIAVALSVLVRLLATLAFSSRAVHSGFLRLPVGGRSPSAGAVALGRLPYFPVPAAALYSLLLVTIVQHLMGIAIALLGYAVLHYSGLPAWTQWPCLKA